MSSVLASSANVKQGNSLFVFLSAPAVTDLLTATAGNAFTTVPTPLAAGAVLRDMGKTIRVPATLQSGSHQEVLRKVQLFDAAVETGLVNGVPANGFVGFNEGVGGIPEFYIRVVPNGVHGVVVAKTGF